MQHLQHIAELGPLLKRLEVRHVIIAPGSRNAPLIQLFTRDNAFTCFSIVDERVAGYVALGMARQLHQSVVVVTTSGTAVMNLGPAVTEAFYLKVPLIILTADRPLESIPQFNNQVIDQVAPFYNFTKGFYEFPLELRSQPEMNQALVAFEQLICEGSQKPDGPVHVNIPMAEPLYDFLPDPILTIKQTKNEPYSEDNSYSADDPYASEELSSAFQSISIKTKILVLAGIGVYEKETRLLLSKLCDSGPVVVIAENITNLQSDQFIANPELILAAASEEEMRELSPDLVISFGGQVVSKRLKQFVKSLKGLETMIIEGDPIAALKALHGSYKETQQGIINDYSEVWKQIETSRLTSASLYMEGAPFCNLTTIQEVLRSIPKDTVVHLGNGSTIRYAQFMPVRHDLVYYANRGTSGIDGSVSTAVGAALVSDQKHVLLLGDLSFVYDSNSLWNKNFPGNLKIIVLNDGGGGIFRLLEGPDRMEFFEEFSVTHHPVSLELLAQSYGRNLRKINNKEELIAVLSLLFQPNSSFSILEVDTSNSENSRIFKEFLE